MTATEGGTRLGIGWPLARALMAGGQLLTVATNHPRGITALKPSLQPACSGVNQVLLPCVMSGGEYTWWPHITVALLLAVVASGILPRLTGLLHVYATMTLAEYLATSDGGDQVAIALSVLILPICLFDGRFNTWRSSLALPPWATISLFAARLQVAYIYAEAALSKLSEATWREGTSVYYWATGIYFGPAPWARDGIAALLEGQAIVLLATYGTLVLELSLALSLLAPARARAGLFGLGALFHLGIGATFGIWSFAIIMIGSLLILTLVDIKHLCARFRARARPLAVTE